MRKKEVGKENSKSLLRLAAFGSFGKLFNFVFVSHKILQWGCFAVCRVSDQQIWFAVNLPETFWPYCMKICRVFESANKLTSCRSWFAVFYWWLSTQNVEHLWHTRTVGQTVEHCQEIFGRLCQFPVDFQDFEDTRTNVHLGPSVTPPPVHQVHSFKTSTRACSGGSPLSVDARFPVLEFPHRW